MPGVPDPLYVAARRVLLDAFDALGPLRRALILVGAQAVYCHAGEADLATKIRERESTASRLENKDALDIYRLLRAVETAELAVRFARIKKDPISSATTAVAISEFARLFGSAQAPGCSMAVDAAGPAEDGEILAASCTALAADLLDEIG